MRTLFLAFLATVLPMAVLAGQPVDYAVGGAAYQGYGAKAAGKSKGMVLIIHDWDGLTGYEEKRVEMLAALGYDAFALDLFGKGNRPRQIAGMRAETGKLYKDRNRMQSLVLGGLKAAKNFSAADTVVIGYCFGGAVALELARSGRAGKIAGYATFHGGLATPKGQTYPKGTPPMLIAHGGADRAITMDQVAALSRELERVGITYEIQVYSGAPHAFTVFGSSRYRKRADRQSWAAFKTFLAANLSGG
ncbi:MAG: dienelactone hydrolase family protein [bacterium]